MFILEPDQLRLQRVNEIESGSLFYMPSPQPGLAIAINFDGNPGFMALEGEQALCCFSLTVDEQHPLVLAVLSQLEMLIDVRKSPVPHRRLPHGQEYFGLLAIDHDGMSIVAKQPVSGAAYNFRRLRVTDWTVAPKNETIVDQHFVDSWRLLVMPKYSQSAQVICSFGE